jgi:hypothetical protein
MPAVADPARTNTVGHTSWAAPMKFVMLENAQAGALLGRGDANSDTVHRR